MRATSYSGTCVLARTDDMFIVRGVNVYPSAVVAVVGEFHPHVSGRARVVLPIGAVTVDPPIEVHVESGAAAVPDDLAARIADAIRQRLTFRAHVELVRRQTSAMPVTRRTWSCAADLPPSPQNMVLSLADESGMTCSTSQCSTILPSPSKRKMSIPA